MPVCVDEKLKMQAAVYVRFSSHSQRETSIDQQIFVCRRYAESHGLEIVEIYEDRAMTGTNDNRPDFKRMIADSSSGRWQVLLVYAFDRFARNRYDSAVYKRELRNNGIRVLSATEAISDDPTGIIVESLMEGMAEYYSAELSAKIRRGMDDNARKFMTLGAVPLGYCRGKDGKYQIVESEAAIVREIFKRVLTEPIADILQDLNARNISTKSGKPWVKSSMNKLLINDRYIGIYTYKGQKTPDVIPPILDKETFYRVQEHLYLKPRSRSVPGCTQKRRNENGVYLLTGKAFCGECGEPMTGKSGHSKTGALHYYYKCRGRTAHVCDNAPMRRDDLERYVAACLRELILDDTVIEAIADSTVQYQNSLAGASDLDNLTDKLKEIETSLKNIMRAIELGIFNVTTKSRMDELEQQRQQITCQIESIKSRMGEMMSKEEIIAALQIFREGDIEDKRYQEALFDAFLVSVHVYSDRYKIIATVGGQQKAIEQNLINSPSDSPDPSDFCDSVRLEITQHHHFTLSEPVITISEGLLFIFAQKAHQ